MEMSDSFNFNAPQYVDFTSPSPLELSEYGEDYFDIDHELIVKCQENIIKVDINDSGTHSIENTPVSSENLNDECTPDSEKQNNEDEYYETHTSLITYDDEDKENQCTPLRRSISAGNLALNLIPTEVEIQNAHNMEENICQAIKALELSGKKKKFSSIISKEILEAKPKLENGKTRYTTFASKPRSSCVSRENLHNMSLHSSLKRKMSAEELGPNKYISTAEYVNKFHSKTPDRFHSRPKNNQLGYIKQVPLSRTIPQSPMLTTKGRTRPVYYTPHEQKEQKVVDEMKKHQVKAHPINYKIFEQPTLSLKKDKKPTTKLEPFNITEIKTKKPPSPTPEVFEFHARPVPKSLREPTIKPSVLPATKTNFNPCLKIRKYKQDKVPVINENSVGNQVSVKSVNMHHDGVAKIVDKPAKTKVIPFSFEERDKRMLEKKEETIKKFLEEEKKKREFHANPIPPKIKAGSCGPVQSKLNQSRDRNASKSNETLSTSNEQDLETTIFKARPATVVHKKPFIPKKDERPATAICEFSLSSQRRAKEREEYNRKIKEREQELELLRKEYEEMKQKEDMKEIAQIRKETIHKANPVRHYKHFEIQQSSKKITSPKSPAFSHKKAATEDE